MKTLSLNLGVAILLAALAMPALATNGYFSHGKGARNKATAGAGSAAPVNAIDVATNPAAAALVGDRVDFGVSLFSPRRSYSTTTSLANGNGGAFTIGPNAIDSAREGFLIPNIARNWSFGSHAFALALYGRGGMNTAWQGGSATFDPDGPGPATATEFDGTFGGGAAGVDLAQAFVELVYAIRASENLSLGVSAVLAVQRFEATGVGTFAPFTRSFATSGGAALPENLSDRGHDLSYGGGLKLGVLARVAPRVRVSLAYQSRLYMTRFDDYADLFAEGGDFDIPANLNAGVALSLGDRAELYVDVEHTWFSDIDAVGNPVASIFRCPTAGLGGTDVEACLGGERGAGFGWDDVTVVKIGGQWAANDTWTWRAGLSFAEQPIAASEVTFNILAPGVIEQHYTLGFTRKLGRNGEINAALMYAPEKSVSGANAFDPSQSIVLKMRQVEFELGYGRRF